MNYAHLYNLKQKTKFKKLKRKEIILGLILIIALFSIIGLVGKIEISSIVYLGT